MTISPTSVDDSIPNICWCSILPSPTLIFDLHTHLKWVFHLSSYKEKYKSLKQTRKPWRCAACNHCSMTDWFNIVDTRDAGSSNNLCHKISQKINLLLKLAQSMLMMVDFIQQRNEDFSLALNGWQYMSHLIPRRGLLVGTSIFCQNNTNSVEECTTCTISVLFPWNLCRKIST